MGGKSWPLCPDSATKTAFAANFVPSKLFKKQIYQHFLAFNFMCVCPFAMARLGVIELFCGT